MNASEFKALKEIVVAGLERRHNTFCLDGLHYVFHDDQVKYDDESKTGMTLIFSSLELRFKIIMLYALDKTKQHYTQSKETTDEYYFLTVRQKEVLITLLNAKC